MRAHDWGLRLSTELAKLAPLALAGCAAAADAPPVVPPPSPTSVPVAAPARAAQPGLSPLAFALAPPASPRQRPLRADRTALRFGGGAFVHEALDWRRVSPDCPLAAGGACAVFAVQAGAGAWSSPKRAPEAWTTFSPGVSVVYAARKSETTPAIDVVDPSGATRPWLVDSAVRELDEVRVIETTRGPIVFAFAPDGAFVATVVERDGGRVLGPRTALALDSVSAVPNAHSARTVETAGHRAAWGNVHPIALLDRQGKETGEWALVWTQVVPPPFTAPAGKPWHRRDGRAKHDCSSGPISRSLSDASVEKRITLTRFVGSAPAAELVLARPEKLDLDAAELAVAAVPGGVAIDGVAYDTAGKRLAEAPPKSAALEAPTLAPTIADEEEPTGLAFDRPSGEGIALFRRGPEESFGRRFDEGGAYLGAAFPLHDGIASHVTPVVLARVDGAWVAYDRDEERVAWLNGPRAGAVARLPPLGSVVGFVRTAETSVTVVFAGKTVFKQSIDVRTGAVAAAEPMAADGALAVFVRPRDGAPLLVDRHTLHLFDLRTGDDVGDLTETTGALGASKAYDVGGDTVLASRGTKAHTLTWLSTGVAVEYPTALFPRQEPYSYVDVARGPLLPSGVLIPATAGPAIDAALGDVRGRCSLDVVVAAGRVVMACAEPVDPVAPGVRAGLRTLVVDGLR